MPKIIPLVFIFLLAATLNSQNLFAKNTIQLLNEMKGRPEAPNFKLEDQDGNFVQLSDFSGKVVIINFWATWCPPCRKEMPSMNRAWKELKKDDIVMLALNVGEDSDLIFAFTAEYPVEFPLLMDRTSSVARDWKVRGLPSTYIVDPDGKIVYQAIGGREWDNIEILDQIRNLKKK